MSDAFPPQPKWQVGESRAPAGPSLRGHLRGMLRFVCDHCHVQERQHYVGGREHMYMSASRSFASAGGGAYIRRLLVTPRLDGYVAAVDEEFEACDARDSGW